MKRIYLAAVVTLVFSSSCGNQNTSKNPTFLEAWNEKNDPVNLGSTFEHQLSMLPLEGKLSQTPWSGDYWYSNQGGIARRWNHPTPQPFEYKTPTREQVEAMSLDELAQLSPAEKYDIAMDRFDYPTVSSELARTAPTDFGWEGLCHGWAPASLHFKEPRAVLYTGKSGIEIPFGAEDVKALLTYNQGHISNASIQILGARCNENISRNATAKNTPECRDTNAGAFHIIVTNMVGLKQEAVIADLDRGEQVWNHPIHAFSAKVLRYQNPSAGAAAGTVQEAVIHTTVTYTKGTSPSWFPKLGTPAQELRKQDYQYRIELDSAGKIIGGEWLSSERPDFLWTQNKARFTGYFQSIGDIYEEATRPLSQTPPGKIECPEGYETLSVGDEGGTVCTKNERVQGPFSSEMRNQCQNWGAGPWCDLSSWGVFLTLDTRGTAFCPQGTALDPHTGYCTEGHHAFGPFPKDLVAQCVALTQKPAACRFHRWNRDFLQDLMQSLNSL